MKRFLDTALRYGVAVLAVGVALGLKLLLDPLITDQSPFLLLAGAVVVGAWFGGLGPGLLATALGALGADYFFLPPEGSFTGLAVAFWPLLLFTLQGILISSLVEALRSARKRAGAERARGQESSGESARERGAFQADGRGGQGLRDLHARPRRMRNDLARRRRAHSRLRGRGDPGSTLLILLPRRRC